MSLVTAQRKTLLVKREDLFQTSCTYKMYNRWVICALLFFFFVGGKNRLETVTQRWKTCAGLALRRLRYTTTHKGVLATKTLTVTKTLKK